MLAAAAHAATKVVVEIVNDPPPPHPASWMHDPTGAPEPGREIAVS